MENIERAEQTVVIQLNGVTVDMDVIAKDAEIEMNNNDAAKNVVEKMANQETMPEMSAEKMEQNDKPKPGESEEGSINTMHTDNGNENDVHNEPTEGDLKVVQAEETNDETIKTTATSEPTSTGTASGMDSKDENQHETESSGTPENSTENPTENSTGNPTEYTSGNLLANSLEKSLENSSDDSSENLSENASEQTTAQSSEKSSEKSEQDTSSSEKISNNEQQKEDAVTATETETETKTETTTATAEAPTAAANDAEAKDGTQADNAENDEANETMKSDSSKKSPKKKSPKKRKNRTHSQKNEVDYSKFVKYTVSVNQRQRRYYLVGTRGFNVPVPGDDCEIFCTNIPINVLEGELIPLFERYGKIWELRLMMSMRNPKRNAGFAFVRFTSAAAANDATQKLDNYEIVPGKHLSVRLSQPNLSLFVGNIHRGLTQEQIHEKIGNKTKGLVKTFVKSSLYEETKNCGFCFLEYDNHSDAVNAKRLLNRGNVWGRQLFVDWAQRRKQPEESDLHESKTLFINYLPKETTEQQITETLCAFGTIQKITKIKDYAFVLFDEHEEANNAMTGADKMKLGHGHVEISLAMPKSMKPRTRYPSFNGHRQRRNGRNRSFKRFNASIGSSNTLYMRNQHKTTNANETTDHNGSTSATVEQTTMPIPNQPETVSHNGTADATVEQTTILPMPDQQQHMANIMVEALVH